MDQIIIQVSLFGHSAALTIVLPRFDFEFWKSSVKRQVNVRKSRVPVIH